MERSWEVPEAVAFSEGSVVLSVKKSIITPCYSTKLSEGESLFIERYLEANDEIVWWFRNGVKSEQFFSVVYKDENEETQNFFPDFIVAYRDGTFGIFDPKSGFTLSEGREKHKALTTYLSQHSGKIIGGFVRIEGTIEPKIYMSESDEYGAESMTGWRRLEVLT